MPIRNIDGLTHDQLQQQIDAGGRFVIYHYVISVLIMSYKRTSEIVFVPPGKGRFGPGFKYTALSAAVGWLGFPWGFIWTPIAIVKNLAGGTDVTADVAPQLGLTAPA